MKKLSHGAEAIIFSDRKTILKQRARKSYRIAEIDERLRLSRARREAKILEKLRESGLKVPKVISLDEKNASLRMEFLKGRKVRDFLAAGNCKKTGEDIGKAVAKMHALNTIHGDLTTSNMILKGKDIYFIDFGLGFFSEKAEDKAVDLHLLRQALNSSHNKIAGKCFDAAIAAYGKSYARGSEVLKRLEKVEARGRYKGKANKKTT